MNPPTTPTPTSAPLVSTSGAVRCLNQPILGMSSPTNLIAQIIPPIEIIQESSFRSNVASNMLQFTTSPGKRARLGIFAAKKDNAERGLILLLPETGTPDAVLICITQQFQQAAASTLNAMGWGKDPLSPEIMRYALLKHVINRYGAQMLASRKQMAMLYILRAAGQELGPFAHDGAFVAQTLNDLRELTNNAFSVSAVEAFTFSSGIVDFNRFLGAAGGSLPVRAVYSIDPIHSMQANAPSGAVRRQFSRQASGPGGFEFLPIGRWVNESKYPLRQTMPNPWPFNYMHNHTMPNYTLYLGLQTS